MTIQHFSKLFLTEAAPKPFSSKSEFESFVKTTAIPNLQKAVTKLFPEFSKIQTDFKITSTVPVKDKTLAGTVDSFKSSVDMYFDGVKHMSLETNMPSGLDHYAKDIRTLTKNYIKTNNVGDVSTKTGKTIDELVKLLKKDFEKFGANIKFGTKTKEDVLFDISAQDIDPKIWNNTMGWGWAGVLDQFKKKHGVVFSPAKSRWNMDGEKESVKLSLK